MFFHVSCQQAEKGFVNLTGVDYSQAAVDLAQSVAEGRKYSISFAVSGFVSEDAPTGGRCKRGNMVKLGSGPYIILFLSRY